ncbi:hypothetical protein ABLB37_22780 [Vibrio parahaemolyticus]|uniref:Uncharacterized protein n=3 Tax=Vibrio parahaemolyticus TaxID=670 RepID=Q87NM3_VIBPA|nr:MULTISPECIES: hypothetical protein [Vibrio harveyi group]EFO36317.1 conserved hypothetical protein [Vibrio parahaemolyticus Peru-466]EFO49256.1 conserved hypothetical protein [Vibrio parahaemolyticus K5030]EVU10563.1 hypothetical protein D046_8118 [Vibrio parahaemolyticus V-223/04]ARC19789.1 hypothetical protein A6J30_15515 [Vibrio parahaemolyticus]AZV70665.1 hypothetical protein D0853_06765 [Vibrio parahaemolyticus]
MELWRTRNESLELLDSDFSDLKFILEQCFRVIDHCIDIFEERSDESSSHNVCGITLVKAKNCALGSYGMMLDGLGQEAGAVMRPMIEYLELLKYFRLFPEDIELALVGKLPSAGVRAKKINGMHHEIRQHFNNYSSHGSYGEHAIRHLFESNGAKLRKIQPLSKGTLFRNLGDLFAQLYILIREAVLCIEWLNDGITEDLADFVDTLHVEGMKVFEFEERLKKS